MGDGTRREKESNDIMTRLSSASRVVGLSVEVRAIKTRISRKMIASIKKNDPTDV